MASTFISVSDLEALLLKELREAEGCSGVRAVTIIVRPPNDWISGAIQAGTADVSVCRGALATIERRLRALYKVTPPKR